MFITVATGKSTVVMASSGEVRGFACLGVKPLSEHMATHFQKDAADTREAANSARSVWRGTRRAVNRMEINWAAQSENASRLVRECACCALGAN